jgi:glycosyltransferase involved in cell wall biosynthesis
MIHSLQLGNVWFKERQGGLARVYYELFRHLPAVGVSFRGLVAGSNQIASSTEGKVEGFSSTDRPLLQRLYSARRAVSKALSTEKIDIVASHFALYTAPALSYIRPLPLVVHFHGPWAAEGGIEGTASIRSRIQGVMEGAVYRRATRFIVLSHAFKRELVERYHIPEDRVRVVPAGVDIERFNCNESRAAAREKLGWPIDRPTVLSVRRLVHRMGLEDLIEATRDIIIKTPDAQVFIAGTGPLAKELQRRIDEHGLGNHVRLLGRLDDDLLPLAYRAADVSIVPTVALEGFGMITLESLASGTPVMVTPVGGLPEVVNQLSESLSLSGTGPQAIARGLGGALQGDLILPNAAKCRSFAAKSFTWPAIADQTRQVYLEALS